MFICNHCLYVLFELGRILGDARDMQPMGIGVAEISANGVITYHQDSYENMVEIPRLHGFSFPYPYDKSQIIAAPIMQFAHPFFWFNRDLELQYRGRLDPSGRKVGPSDLRRDLCEAMKLVAETGLGPKDQIASMGCSIKWKLQWLLTGYS